MVKIALIRLALPMLLGQQRVWMVAVPVRSCQPRDQLPGQVCALASGEVLQLMWNTLVQYDC